MTTIMLAKPFSRKQLEKAGGPYGVSVKLDGVPIRFDLLVKEGVPRLHSAVTRQNEPNPAATVHGHAFVMMLRHISYGLHRWPDGAYTFVAEATHPRFKDFKDVSGIVRSQEHEEHRHLVFNVFDFVHHSRGLLPYDQRMFAAGMLFGHEKMYNKFRVIRNSWYTDLDAAIAHAESIAQDQACEGAIIRSGLDKWEVGKRSWGYQKVVLDPTIDLRLHSYEEAMSADGEPLGMVGRVNVRYKGEVIGVGPGKLDHAERRALWDAHNGRVWPVGQGGMLTVKYKRDPSYAALRQPTFQHWRNDKDTPDA